MPQDVWPALMEQHSRGGTRRTAVRLVIQVSFIGLLLQASTFLYEQSVSVQAARLTGIHIVQLLMANCCFCVAVVCAAVLPIQGTFKRILVPLGCIAVKLFFLRRATKSADPNENLSAEINEILFLYTSGGALTVVCSIWFCIWQCSGMRLKRRRLLTGACLVLALCAVPFVLINIHTAAIHRGLFSRELLTYDHTTSSHVPIACTIDSHVPWIDFIPRRSTNSPLCVSVKQREVTVVERLPDTARFLRHMANIYALSLTQAQCIHVVNGFLIFDFLTGL